MGAGGYKPVLVGRMHSVGPDQLHGYAERLVGDHNPNHPGGSGVDHGELAGTAGPDRVSLEKSGHGQSAYQVHDEDVTAATVDYLNQLGARRRNGEKEEPFSLTVGFMLPPSAVCRPPRGLRVLPCAHDPAADTAAILRRPPSVHQNLARALRHRRGHGRRDAPGTRRVLGARGAHGHHDRADPAGAARQRPR